MKPLVFVWGAVLMLCGALGGPTAVHGDPKTILLATTTSTQDSGLLDVLLPGFEKRTGYFVKTLAVGSGHALVLGRRGEADLLLVHSPSAEREFVREGYGVERQLVMHNDFIIVGPSEDPCRIKGTGSVRGAFEKIFSEGALFLSRGDASGTFFKEMEIWKETGLRPEGRKWYQQTGLGMGQTLTIAAEKKGYTLTDRGTFLALRRTLALDVLVEGDRTLLNIYHALMVNPAKWPKVNARGAKALAHFFVSKEAQAMIGAFGVDRYGSPLFFPDAGKKEEDLGK